MTRSVLEGCRILIVEDEYLIATAFSLELADQGASVVGPAPTVRHALSLIDTGERLDLAVLDANVRGEPFHPIADLLAARAVPFLLVTGYDRNAIPARYQHLPILEKPVEAATVVAALALLRS
ncbi:MAG: response regulator [Luteimonas sp.]